MTQDLLKLSFELGRLALARRSDVERKTLGQFFTPPAVARFMADQLPPVQAGSRVLDPAAGAGVLSSAVIEKAIATGHPLEFWLDCYEIDAELCDMAREAVGDAVAEAERHGIVVHTSFHKADYLLRHVPVQPTLFATQEPSNQLIYDLIIANPPYFKLASDDLRLSYGPEVKPGHANVYTLFMADALRHLTDDGQACFIVPRSFCSGAYFDKFRRHFVREAIPLAIHLFESRQDTFETDEVLQENVIVTFRRRLTFPIVLREGVQEEVKLTASAGISDFQDLPVNRSISTARFWNQRDELFFKLPISELDEQIIETVEAWHGSINKYELGVSTGPVVPFRAKAFLVEAESVQRDESVPLLWMQHVRQHFVQWPIPQLNKPQAIVHSNDSQALLVRTRNYVLTRRFSAKEEVSRIVAAPLIAARMHHQWLGLENHLNYIYRKHGELTDDETNGLSALLNCTLIDRYIRVVNGNTQVNAAELRALPLPEWHVIQQLGTQVVRLYSHGELRAGLATTIDELVYNVLRQHGCIPVDLPRLKESRTTMTKIGKIQQAQQILKAFGLPPAQCNELSALTLLVLCQISEVTPWSQANAKSLRIHDILTEIGERYDRHYAENTRETVRRQVIHQFIQAGVVVRNAEEPSLPTNSPRTCYTISNVVLEVVRAYRTRHWQEKLDAFHQIYGNLLTLYQKGRTITTVPLRLTTGEEYHLSAGKHNELQSAVIELFGPRFAPGSKVLYLGDTARKSLILDVDMLETLGVLLTSHDKLPDLILYDEPRSRLFLIEAVTSHGPVTPKRYEELEEIFKTVNAQRIYVSAFLDFITFRRFLTKIAWETEVWLAEMPDHMIHFNGDHFLATST